MRNICKIKLFLRYKDPFPRYTVPDWNVQIAQFQRFLQWQQHQQMLFEQERTQHETYCGVSLQLIYKTGFTD
jgi:hypothetical protein